MDEKRLIKKCQNGNEEAFNELISAYYPFVYKFLLKITSNETLAQDLTQETFLKLIKTIEFFDLSKSEKFSTYIIAIAKNNYLDYLKKTKREFYDIDFNTIIDSNFIDEEVIKKEEINSLLEEIENLTEEQKIAIKLKYLENYTIDEISEKLKEKPQTIKSRLFEARKKLKNNLTRRNNLWKKD